MIILLSIPFLVFSIILMVELIQFGFTQESSVFLILVLIPLLVFYKTPIIHYSEYRIVDTVSIDGTSLKLSYSDIFKINKCIHYEYDSFKHDPIQFNNKYELVDPSFCANN